MMENDAAKNQSSRQAPAEGKKRAKKGKGGASSGSGATLGATVRWNNCAAANPGRGVRGVHRRNRHVPSPFHSPQPAHPTRVIPARIYASCSECGVWKSWHPAQRPDIVHLLQTLLNCASWPVRVDMAAVASMGTLPVQSRARMRAPDTYLCEGFQQVWEGGFAGVGRAEVPGRHARIRASAVRYLNSTEA